MTLQFALCNLHFAIAVRLSCPSGIQYVRRNGSMQNTECKLKNAK